MTRRFPHRGRAAALVVLAAGCGSHGHAMLDGSTGDAGAQGPTTAVLELHGGGTRAGAYVAPNLTHAAAAKLHVDPSFTATYSGAAFAQPLYVDGGGAGDLVIAATEMNQVSAFDPTGHVVWQRTLGTPQPMPNAAEGTPCGDINPLGITGTPVIDLPSRTMFLDAMIHESNAAHHRIFALSIDDGSTRPGWPVDVGSSVTSGGMAFAPAPQNQRGGLTLAQGQVFVPYGGHSGDCGDYHGWLVAVPMADPAHPAGWATADGQAGAWSPGGVTTDGTSVFAVFGNGASTTSWSNSEMVGRFGAGAAFSGDAKDYWVPSNWQQLDQTDLDLTGPALVLDLPGSTPSRLIVTSGKDGSVYLLDRDNLGGIADPLASLAISTVSIINTSAAYHTRQGTYLVFKAAGMSGCPNAPSGGSNIVAVRIAPGAPPTLQLAWCAGTGPVGSPIATTTDGTSDPIVWAVGAEGDQRLHGYDGDTGAVVFDGGGPGDAMTSTSRFITPMVAKGRIFVAANGQLYAFTTN